MDLRSHLGGPGLVEVAAVGQDGSDGGRHQDPLQDVQTPVLTLYRRLQHRGPVHQNLTLHIRIMYLINLKYMLLIYNLSLDQSNIRN